MRLVKVYCGTCGQVYGGRLALKSHYRNSQACSPDDPITEDIKYHCRLCNEQFDMKVSAEREQVQISHRVRTNFVKLVTGSLHNKLFQFLLEYSLEILYNLDSNSGAYFQNRSLGDIPADYKYLQTVHKDAYSGSTCSKEILICN